MKFLFDTNLWYELFLDGSHANEVRSLIDAVPGRLIATTDFAVYSLAIALVKRPTMFQRFVNDILDYEIGILHLPLTWFNQVSEVMIAHQLDFDDGVQYVAAEQYDLSLVSFDSDFDRTPRGRVTPAQALQALDGGSTP